MGGSVIFLYKNRKKISSAIQCTDRDQWVTEESAVSIVTVVVHVNGISRGVNVALHAAEILVVRVVEIQEQHAETVSWGEKNVKWALTLDVCTNPLTAGVAYIRVFIFY